MCTLNKYRAKIQDQSKIIFIERLLLRCGKAIELKKNRPYHVGRQHWEVGARQSIRPERLGDMRVRPLLCLTGVCSVSALIGYGLVVCFDHSQSRNGLLFLGRYETAQHSIKSAQSVSHTRCVSEILGVRISREDVCLTRTVITKIYESLIELCYHQVLVWHVCISDQ